MKGWVYVLSCTGSFLLKVGKSSKHPDHRIIELQSTGVPGKLELVWCVFTDQFDQIERDAHRALGSARKHNEWFEVEAHEARDAVVHAMDARRVRGEMFGGPLATVGAPAVVPPSRPVALLDQMLEASPRHMRELTPNRAKRQKSYCTGEDGCRCLPCMETEVRWQQTVERQANMPRSVPDKTALRPKQHWDAALGQWVRTYHIK